MYIYGQRTLYVTNVVKNNVHNMKHKYIFVWFYL